MKTKILIKDISTENETDQNWLNQRKWDTEVLIKFTSESDGEKCWIVPYY